MHDKGENGASMTSPGGIDTFFAQFQYTKLLNVCFHVSNLRKGITAHSYTFSRRKFDEKFNSEEKINVGSRGAGAGVRYGSYKKHIFVFLKSKLFSTIN